MANETFQLIVQQGSQPGQIFTIEVDNLIIGRDPLADILLDDPKVSRHHTRLIRRGATFEVHDLGSTNGTFVAGRRLAAEPVLLESGQLIQLGSNVVLVFRHIPAADPNAATLSTRDDADGTVIVKLEPAPQSDATAHLPPFDPRKNPYVGPRAFEPNEREFFYGRDDEIAILQGQVMSRRASLFFAQSGAGKSSLLRAGLIPELTRQQKIGRGRRAHTYQRMEVLPILSVGGGIPAGMKAPIDNVYVFSAVYALYPDADPNEIAGLSISDGLAGFFGGAPAEAKEDTTVIPVALKTAEDSGGAMLLIFDQFEELFHFHPERWRDREGFFGQVSQALVDYPNLHVLFTMREDYIAELTPYANLLPGQLRARFRLERLKREAAMSAVKAPAEKAGRAFSEGVAEALVDNLRRSQTGKTKPDGQAAADAELGEYVEPVHLQIVCRQLWENLPAKRRIIEKADVQEFGDVDQALIGFYESTLAQVCVYGGMSQRRLRTWFDEDLITPARTRGLVYRGDNETEGLANDAVDVLNDAYIIRASVRGGDIWYELAHDRLVEPILGANQAWRVNYENPLDKATQAWLAAGRDPLRLLDGVQLVEAQAYADDHPEDVLEEEKDFLEESRRQEIFQAEQARQATRRRRLTIIAAAVVVAVLTVATVVAIAFGGYAGRQAIIAGEAKEKADAAAQKAEEAAQEADEAAVQAEFAQREAQRLEGVALDEADRAEAEANKALEAQGAAEAAQEEAELLSRRSLAESMAANAMTEAGQDISDPSLALILARDSVLMTRAVDGFVLDNSRNALLAAVAGAPPWKLNLPRSRHIGPVNGSRFSPDGQRFVTAGSDGTARIWDVATGEEILNLVGHGGAVWSAVFDPNGTRVVTSSQDGTAIVWDALSGEELVVLEGHDDVVLWATFSPDGANIATASFDESAKVWDAESGVEILTLAGHLGFVQSVNYSYDGSRIVTAGDDGLAIVWDAENGEILLELAEHETFLGYAAFDPTDRRIVTTDWDGRAILWDADSGEMLFILEEHIDAVRMADFNSAGTTVITAGLDELLIEWDVETGEQTGLRLFHQFGVNSVDIDPQDRMVLTTGNDAALIITDLDTSEKLLTLGGHTGEVLAGAFSPDGDSAITSSADGTVRVWDVATGEELLTINVETYPNSFALSPDGSRFVIGDFEGLVNVWDISDSEAIFELEGHEGPVNAIAYNADGDLIVTSGEDGQVIFWDADGGEALFVLTDAHDGSYISDALLSPDGSRLLTAAELFGIRVWDVETAELILEIPYFGVLSAQYDPDGKRFVTASSDRTAQIWDAENGEKLLALEGHRNYVRSAAFSPDGEQIVTTSDDTTARVWDADTGEEILTLSGHQHWMTSAMFDPSGQLILTTSRDGTAKIWEPNAPQSTPSLDHDGVALNQASFSGDGQQVLTIDNEGRSTVWDTTTGEALFDLSELNDSFWLYNMSPVDAQFATLSDEGIQIWDAYSGDMITRMEALLDADGNEVFNNAISYSPDGAYIVALGSDNSLVVFDVIDGKVINRLEGHDEYVYQAQFSQDGARVVSAGCDEVDGDGVCVVGPAKVWDVSSGDLLLRLPYDGEVIGVSFNPDGNMVAASTGYETGVLWDLDTKEIVLEISQTGFEPPLFSPDGRSILVIDGFVANIWDIENLFLRAALIGHLDEITHAAFSPDGKNIITSNWDGTARIWNAETGIESLLVDEHSGQVWWAEFSPDGERIVTASEDGTAIIWPYSIDRLLEMTGPLIQRSTPVLSPEEIVRLGLDVE